VCFGVAWLQELRAQFAVPSLTAPDEQQLLTAWWRRLSHALGGLFCASLNFVARSEATALQVTELVQSNPACHQHQASAASPADAGRGEPVRPGGSDGSAEGPQSESPGPAAGGPGGGSSSCSWLPRSSPDRARRVLSAALPQEASCTENLTPWLKLLPCR
jgi:hypothetical protein